MRLSWLLSCVWPATAQQLGKTVFSPLDCPAEERVGEGDRVLLDYTGWLGDGREFDKGTAEFVVGEGTVIKGWEEGIIGQCAGERLNMTVPPDLWAVGYTYGDNHPGKVPASATLHFLLTLNGIVRVTKHPPDGDCYRSEKAGPGKYVSMSIKAWVSNPDGRGETFFNQASLQIKFGESDAIQFVQGLEATLEGACIEEKRILFLGPNLAYGDKGKNDGSVKPGDSVIVEVEILSVGNTKSKKAGPGFLEKLSSSQEGTLRSYGRIDLNLWSG